MREDHETVRVRGWAAASALIPADWTVFPRELGPEAISHKSWSEAKTTCHRSPGGAHLQIKGVDPGFKSHSGHLGQEVLLVGVSSCTPKSCKSDFQSENIREVANP